MENFVRWEIIVFNLTGLPIKPAPVKSFSGTLLLRDYFLQGGAGVAVGKPLSQSNQTVSYTVDTNESWSEILSVPTVC